jgi:hypothetical protein
LGDVSLIGHVGDGLGGILFEDAEQVGEHELGLAVPGRGVSHDPHGLLDRTIQQVDVAL